MKLFRASGNPIDQEAKEALKNNSRIKFDELEATHGKFTQELSAIFTEELQKIEDEYKAKYPVYIEFKLEDIETIVRQFKSAVALTLVQNPDKSEEIAAFLMDTE